MYKCEDCGELYEKAPVCRENRGEFWGDSAEEEIAVCDCGGTLVDAEQCAICGEYYAEYELISGVCDCCISKQNSNVDFCVEVGEICPESVKINGFLASMFSADEINEILKREIKGATGVDCSEFIATDKSWFAEKLKEVTK